MRINEYLEKIIEGEEWFNHSSPSICFVLISLYELLKFRENLVCYLLLLVFSDFYVLRKVHIGLVVYWDEVYVGMWDFKPEDNLSYFLAWESCPDGACHLLGKQLELCQIGIFHVENIINLFAWNHQSVGFPYWVDVKEGIEFLVFSAFVAWYLTGCNL